MRKLTLLYIPLFILFAFSLAVLAIHWNKIFQMFNVALSQIEMPLILSAKINSY